VRNPLTRLIAVEDGEEDEEIRPRKKKRRLQRSRRRSESPVLDEEDLDLLDENLGNQSRRRSPSQKFKRIRRGGRSPSPTRPRGVEGIFSDEEGEEDLDVGPPRGEFDDFIEDDEPESEEDDLLKEARRIQRERLKAQHRTTYLPNDAGIDADAMEEITQLFGDGLDYEFAMYPSDEEAEYVEEGEEKAKEVQLKDIFEPSELKERLLTDEDELIRITDEPERFQLYRPSQAAPLDIDVEKESNWIADRLLAREYKRRVGPELEEPFRQAVTHVLGFFNTDSLEVPFIWQHRRDFLYFPDRETDEVTGNVVLKALRVLIDQDDLWKIWEEDNRYRAIQQRLAGLKTIWEGLGMNDRVVEDGMAEVSSVEDVQGFCSPKTNSDIDLHDYIYFTYSEQIRDQQLLQSGTNGHSAGYKRAAGNKMAVWEKIRKGGIYHLVQVIFNLTLANLRHLGYLQATLGPVSKRAQGGIGLRIQI
jgi:transcription elongation factor SPT6